MSDFRWLDAEEQRTWRIYLATVQAIDDAVDRGTAIPRTYYEILVRLSEAPGRLLRMSDLAERSLSSRSRISHAVNRLEQRGWVSRCASSDDGRGTVATLTDAGFAALAEAAPGHVTAVREQIFDRLTREQLRQLAEIGEAVLGPDWVAA